MNDGRHPVTNETVVPSEVIDHVSTGLSVSEGKASYPELVHLNLIIAIHTKFTFKFTRVQRSTGAVSGASPTKAMK